MYITRASRIARFLFFSFIVRPIIFLVLGINCRRREWIPKQGPAIIVANHNSHLDTLVLMMVCPSAILDQVRPVAAADYWMKNKWIAWFATNVIRIIPIERRRDKRTGDPLDAISQALDEKQIVIFFPEGSRGEPEEMSQFKVGIAKLAERHPDVPVCPVFMRGLGRALPRGEGLLVPVFIDVFVGESMKWNGDPQRFMDELTRRFKSLSSEGYVPQWE